LNRGPGSRNGMRPASGRAPRVVGEPSSLPVILEKANHRLLGSPRRRNFTQIAGDSPLRGNDPSFNNSPSSLGRPSPDFLRQFVGIRPPDLIGDLRSAASSAGSPSASTAGKPARCQLIQSRLHDNHERHSALTRGGGTSSRTAGRRVFNDGHGRLR